MHMQPLYNDCDYITLGDNIGEKVFSRGLCLPSDIKMTEEQIAAYCERWQSLKNFKNSPGGYSAAEAGQVLRDLFLK